MFVFLVSKGVLISFLVSDTKTKLFGVWCTGNYYLVFGAQDQPHVCRAQINTTVVCCGACGPGVGLVETLRFVCPGIVFIWAQNKHIQCLVGLM